MLFDDRLATVLRHRATGNAAARTQYRQLLDLLGSHDLASKKSIRLMASDESLQAAAWLRLSALSEMIPTNQRARLVNEAGSRFRNPQLTSHLAQDEPAVAANAIAQSNLSEEDWLTLIPRLPIRARGYLRLRKDMPDGAQVLLDQLGVHDRGLPIPSKAPVKTTELQTPSPVQDAKSEKQLEAAQLSGSDQVQKILNDTTPRTTASETEKSEIAELVERIAQFRKTQNPIPVSAPNPVTGESSPRLPLEDTPFARSKELTGFSFVADTAGRIEWAEGKVAPMVIGKRLRPPRQLGLINSRDKISHNFSTHQPIEGAIITLDGAPAIAGDWVVDAQPRFSRPAGRFHGFIGRMRRPVLKTASGAAAEADKVRQLLHELRTPVNALQGFAEIIQQQLFGPAPNEYRALAANIASDSARILAGFDELERLARLESGAFPLPEGNCDIAAILGHMTQQLQGVLAPRMAGFDLDDNTPAAVQVTLEQDDAEAMVWRIMATLAGSCETGETLAITIEIAGEKAHLSWDMPEQLLTENNPFSAQIKPDTGGLSAGLFGAGFSLRLARAEARVFGGELTAIEGRIILILPVLTSEMKQNIYAPLSPILGATLDQNAEPN